MTYDDKKEPTERNESVANFHINQSLEYRYRYKMRYRYVLTILKTFYRVGDLRSSNEFIYFFFKMCEYRHSTGAGRVPMFLNLNCGNRNAAKNPIAGRVTQTGPD
jgi:hypothetical protein